MSTTLWMIFLAASAFFVFVSRRSLLKPDEHGFYRFLAWEVLLYLCLRNLAGWFANPFSWHQMISWLLLFGSIPLVVGGIWLLRQVGKLDPGRQEPGLLGLEKTSRLVTEGLYRYIRHPLYASLLCLAWGLYFKSPSLVDVLLAAASSLLLVATARAEERENVSYFGDAYRQYMRRTKMFIPFVV